MFLFGEKRINSENDPSSRTETPESMNCQKCGTETFLPFQCPYCGGQFCAAHRLPENHECSKMDLARAAKQGKTVSTQVPKTYEHKVTIGRPLQTKGRVYFSPKEVKHLAVAGLLVFGIGFSPILNLNLSSFAILLGTLTIFASILAGSFFAHEMAHKITAQKRGLWAEFRLTLWGAVLTAISVITPFFKIIAPGAVMISGSARNDDMGKVSLAGPVTNIVLSSGLLGLAFVPSGIAWVLFWSSLLNGFMAVFNLIPFGIFDGFKVFSWNKGIWVVAFVASAALTVVSYFFVQSSIG